MSLTKHAASIAPENPSIHALLVSLYLEFNHSHLVPAYLESLPPEVAESTELQQFYCFALKINYRPEEADKIYRNLIAKRHVPASFHIALRTATFLMF